MALFKLLRGQESDLVNQPLHDGYVWVTKDLQNMWFDYYDETNTLVRKRINSEFADKLRYIKDGETVELDPSEIATKSELATKLSAQNPSAAGALTISNNWENGVASFYKSNDSTNDYGTVIRDQDADANALSVVISAKNKSVSITDGESYYDVLTTEDMATLQTQLDNKVDKVAGKGLSTNDLTNALKGNYDTAYTHSQSAHAPVGAQANVIESIKVNGTALPITSKAVNITVPTGALASKSKVSESDLDSSLATKLNGMTDADELEAAISAEAQRVDTALSGKANTSHSHNDVYYTETEVDTKLDNKVDKVNGKGLSTNDYTTTEKNKLAGIEAGANNYVLPSATDSVAGGMKLYTATGTNTAGTMTQKAITDALAGKSGTGHNHDSVYSKLGHTHTAAEVGATTQTYVDNQIKDAKSYTDTKVAGLVDSAPETLNTLNELAAALGDDPNFATTMATELGKKATKTELSTHASSNIHITSAERTNWNAAKTHADSTHAPSNAERNIIVGIQKNGTDVTVNSTTRKVNITVPTKTSELTNNSDFATNASVASVKDELQANIDGKANSSHGNHVPTTQTASNKVFLRNDNTWATVTPANIGAAASSHTHSYLPLSGGTIDGRLSVHGYGNNGGLNLDGYQGRLELRAEIGTASIACVDGTNSAALIFSPNKPANEGVKFSMKKDSTLSLYKLYGEHNKPTAQDIGAADAKATSDALASKANYSDVNSALAKKANTSDLAGKVNTSDVINIAHGGTGATDGSGALYNLINRQDFPTSSTTLGYGEYRLIGGSYSWYGLPDGAWGSLIRFPGWDGYNFELCMITANATEGLYYRDFMDNTWIRIPTVYNSLGGKISTWLPSNGANPTADVNGFFAYSTNTGLVPSYGFPNGFSEYGTIFGVTGTSYPIIMYVDVFGNFAVYNTNQGRWNISSGSGSGSGSSVTYGLVKSGNTITLTGSDGSSSSVTDDAGGGMTREFQSGIMATNSYSCNGNASKIYVVTVGVVDGGVSHSIVIDYYAIANGGRSYQIPNTEYTLYASISGSTVTFSASDNFIRHVAGYY